MPVKKPRKPIVKPEVKPTEPELTGLGDAPTTDSVALEAPTEDGDTSDKVA